MASCFSRLTVSGLLLCPVLPWYLPVLSEPVRAWLVAEICQRIVNDGQARR